jgi:predicted Zn-ribbon and HTH transcriptional regulator
METNMSKLIPFPKHSAVILDFEECKAKLLKGEEFEGHEKPDVVEVVIHEGKQILKGPAQCKSCGHEWEHMCDIGEGFTHQCIKCGSDKGVWKTFVYTEEGRARRMCGYCDSELFSIYGNGEILCAGCGTVTDLRKDYESLEAQTGEKPPEEI